MRTPSAISTVQLDAKQITQPLCLHPTAGLGQPHLTLAFTVKVQSPTAWLQKSHLTSELLQNVWPVAIMPYSATCPLHGTSMPRALSATDIMRMQKPKGLTYQVYIHKQFGNPLQG